MKSFFRKVENKNVCLNKSPNVILQCFIRKLDVRIAEKEQAKKVFEESKVPVSGSGDTATEVITLKAGWAIFEGSHTGGANFAVHLQDETGNDMELLVNTI